MQRRILRVVQSATLHFNSQGNQAWHLTAQMISTIITILLLILQEVTPTKVGKCVQKEDEPFVQKVRNCSHCFIQKLSVAITSGIAY